MGGELHVDGVRLELESVERALFRKVLELGRQLFGAFLTAIGNGDRGKEVTVLNTSLDARADAAANAEAIASSAETRVLKRFAVVHRQRLLTVFGEFTLSRCVYAEDERQAIEFAPTDQRLQLPASEVSYLLQEWDQLLGIEQAFGAVRDRWPSRRRHFACSNRLPIRRPKGSC